MFGQRRNVGRHGRTFGLGSAQGHYLAAADVRQPAGQHKHAVLQVAAQQVVGQRCHAAVRDVGEEHTGLFLHHFARQVQRCAHARTAVAELARVGLGALQEFANGLDTGVGGRHQHQRLRCNHANGREVGEFVFDRAGHQPVDGDFVVGSHQQGVAVRRGVGHFLRANRATGTADVLDHHRHTQAGGQLLTKVAPGQVGAATGWIGHHDGDGFVGVGITLGAGRVAGEQGQAAHTQGELRQVGAAEDWFFWHRGLSLG